MAFTQNNKKDYGDGTQKVITYGRGMAGGETSYFHFEDLQKIRDKYNGLPKDKQPTGFRVVDGSLDGNACAILLLVREKEITGADFIFDREKDSSQDGDWMAFSCPRLVDPIGGIEYEVIRGAIEKAFKELNISLKESITNQKF